jgi:ketosteroid isomerase-like protein
VPIKRTGAGSTLLQNSIGLHKITVMHRFILFIILLLPFTQIMAQGKDETAIRNLLHTQTEAWNRGSIETFMVGYWQNDSMMFIGKNGIRYGWVETLNNYKKGYPDTAAMGKLKFTLLQLKKLSKKYFYVVGKWHLTRTAGNLEGHYTLLFQKIKGKWQIIADHSS